MYDHSSAGSPPPWSIVASAGSNVSSTVSVSHSVSVPPPISRVASAWLNPVPPVPPVPVPPVPPPVVVFPPVAPLGNEVGMSSLLSPGFGFGVGVGSGVGSGVSGAGATGVVSGVDSGVGVDGVCVSGAGVVGLGGVGFVPVVGVIGLPFVSTKSVFAGPEPPLLTCFVL